jgi:hypothetical protein
MLSVLVGDPNGDRMDVTFYDADTHTVIGVVHNVKNYYRAGVYWIGLLPGNTYSWYAVASDGTHETTSNTWSFST